MSAPTSAKSSTAAVVVACVALFTDMFIYGLAIPVLPLLPATVDAGPAATGLLFASYAAAMLAATPVAGALVDRRGPRTSLLLGLFGLAAATVLFAVGAPFWLLLVGRSLQGFAAGMAWVASLSLIAATVPFTKRGPTMGAAMSMISVGILLGPPVGGLLVEHFGTVVPFLLAAALAVLDGIARVVFVRVDHHATDDPTGPVAVLRVPGTGPVVVVVLLSAAMIAAIEPVLPLHLSRAFDTSALGIGLLFGLTVVVGAVLNPIVGALIGKVDARVLVGIGILTATAGLVVLGRSDRLWLVIVAMVLLGAAVAFLSAPATTLIGFQGQHTDPPALGGAYTLFNLAYGTGLMAGPALAGALTDAFDLRVALLILGAALLATGLTVAARLPDGLSVSGVAAAESGEPRRENSRGGSREHQ
ncbi:putative arabinose efflux permease, MFS family [Nocardia amikacinitolerans]|uniref:MFS transporter n=1 Tax=Nocardia amikacinitolerans TaxID=756689 RepID=UPI000AEE670A|nr:MFS transporter [Nocardia amikacinitolerans]MCP2319286.1 putative arabinose efflux permease, MFS family [Nocardia amikacinitolerans]